MLRPALLWNGADGSARIAEVARAFDVQSIEHEPSSAPLPVRPGNRAPA